MMRKAETMNIPKNLYSRRLSAAHLLACGALLLAVLLPAGQALAQQNAVSVGLVSSFIPGSAYDPLSNDDFQGRLGLAYERALLTLGPGALWADGTYTLGSSRSDLFGEQLSTFAFFQTVTAGVGYRLPIWSWLVPRVRLGLGLLIGHLELEGGDQVLSDWAPAFTGYVLGGVELLWPKPFFRSRRQTIRGGLVVEGGYTFSTSLGFEVEREISDDEEDQLRLPTVAAQVGDLALNGGQLRVSFILHF